MRGVSLNGRAAIGNKVCEVEHALLQRKGVKVKER
jgi:hypothetical protein